MIVQPKVWYLSERAEQLALLHLTRRNELQIKKLHDNNGIDLLVEIYRNDLPTGRMFGILIKARLSPRELFKLDQIDTQLTQNVPFPLCLFAFAMEDDSAYYRWLKQPVVSAEGFTSLTISHATQLNPLTREALDHIVYSIEQWYNAKAIQAN